VSRLHHYVINGLRLLLDWLFFRVRVIVTGDDNDCSQYVAIARNIQSRRFYLKVFVGGIWPLTFLWLRLSSTWFRVRKPMYFLLAFLALGLTSAFVANALGLSNTNNGWGPTHLAMYVVNLTLAMLIVYVMNTPEQHRAAIYALTIPAGFLLTFLALELHNTIISLIFSSLNSSSDSSSHVQGVRGYLLTLGVFLIGVSIWLLTRPLQAIRVSLWDIGDPTSNGLNHHGTSNYDADMANVAIRIDNDQTEQRLEPLRRILSSSPRKAWTVPTQSELDYRGNGVCTINRNWLYAMAWSIRKCTNMLPSPPLLRALRAWAFSLFRRGKLKLPRSALPLQVAPESDTLKLQLTAIARFSFQQYLLPRDANRATPLPVSRDPYQDKIQHDGEWSKVAKDLLVSLRLHSFQLSLYLTLLASMFLLVAYDVRIFKLHEDIKKHIIGPFLWAGFFLAWAIFSLWLRSQQVRALRIWAGWYRGYPFRESPPIFYFRPDRPEDKAWEELVTEDFDVEIKNFGIDHARVVEFTHAALLLIAFDILEKLL